MTPLPILPPVPREPLPEEPKGAPEGEPGCCPRHPYMILPCDFCEDT